MQILDLDFFCTMEKWHLDFSCTKYDKKQNMKTLESIHMIG